MNKPKPEEVMKALECCPNNDCIICPYRNSANFICRDAMIEDALALLRAKDAEIARLTEENDKLHASCTEFERKCASLNDDNERLRAELSKRPTRLLITRKP